MGGLVGRDEELEAIWTVLDDPSLPGIIFEGAPGVGKTSLLRAASDAACERGATVLVGAARELQAIMPFGPFVEALGLHPDADEPRRAAVGSLLRGEVAADLDPGQLRWQAIEGIIDDLEMRARRVPLVLGLEDLHWSDEDTLVALHRVAQAAGQLDVTLVITTRPQPRPPSVDTTLTALRGGGCMQLHVGELSEAAVAVLAQEHLGHVPDEATLAMLAAAGGNPLLVTELLSARAQHASAVPDLPRLGPAVAQRLAGVPEDTVHTLEVASVLGERFHLSDLAGVIGATVSDTSVRLRPALDRGLLHDDADQFAFRHALVRDHLYERLGSATRAALHRTAAEVVGARGARTDIVGAHLMRAPVDDTLAETLVDLAAEIVDRAPDAAAEWTGRALSHLAPGTPVVMRAQVLQARANALGAHPEAAVESARPLLHAGIDDATRADLAATIALAQHFLGITDTTIIDTLVRALDASAGDRGMTRQRTIATLVLTEAGRADEAVHMARQILDDPSVDVGARCLAMEVTAVQRFIRGETEPALEQARAAVELAMSAGVLGEWTGIETVRLYSWVKGIDIFDPVLPDALRKSLAAAERRGFPGPVRTLQVELASNLVWRGEWPEAQLQAEATLADLQGQQVTAALTAWWTLIFIAGRRGDVDTIARAPDPEVVPGPHMYRRPLGFLEAWALAVNQQPDAAWDLAERTRTWLETNERPFPYLYGHTYVLLALRFGHEDRARSFQTQIETASAAMDHHPFMASVVATNRALLDDDRDTALQAVELGRRSPVFPNRVDALIVGGTVVGHHGGTDTATELLNEARKYAVDADATTDIGRIDAALRDLGAIAYRSRGRPAIGWEALTEAEQRIVPLVAEGLVYREIGERLFVSRRTVETHVASIFRKVGVRSRQELATAYQVAQER